MIEKGRLVPNVDVVALDGSRKKLWDFRQQCHLLLLVGDRPAVEAQAARLAERQKTLAWLSLQVLPTASAPEGFPPGAHAIDRYGELIESYPFSEDLPDRIEKDFIYYEACHCG